jgi:hypothetical protein
MESEVYVSALYDGESVPPDAARHISQCENCQRILTDFSKLGAELRLAAALQATELPPLQVPGRRSLLQFLGTRIAIPRFALAGLVACIVLAGATAALVHAQNRPLWFQFAYSLNKDSQFPYCVAKAGYDNSGATMTASANGAPEGAAVRVQVESISSGDVALRVRAIQPRFETTSTGTRLLPSDRKISLDGIPVVHYRPGETLIIPIEGGRSLYLKGEVVDHQPQIAFGVPLEPPAEQMVVRSAVLMNGERLIGNFAGASSTANNEDAVIAMTGQNGAFLFGLKPFPGAVEGQANWGELTFSLDGENYRLLAAAPITSGDQPRVVWVRHDANEGAPYSAGIGARPMPK